MMLRRFGLRLSVLACLAAAPAAPAAPPDDPEFNGRRGSEWVRILKDDAAARKRRAAVVALGQLWADGQYKPAVPNLGRALQQDPSAAVRLQAAAALGQMKKEEVARHEDARAALAALIGALQIEKESAVKREVAAVLGRLGEVSKGAVSALSKTLTDADAATRAAAAEALGRIGPDAKAAAAELMPLLKDTDPAVCRAAAFALGRVAPEEIDAVGTALAGLLKAEKDAAFRKELVVSLGLLGDRSEAVTAGLTAALGDADADVRRQAARALGGFGLAIQPAIPALLKSFQGDADKNVRIDALCALGSGLGANVKELLAVLTARLNIDPEAKPKGDPDYEVRIAVADELGRTRGGREGRHPGVAAHQRDPQVKVREAATAAIRRIEKPAEKKP